MGVRDDRGHRRAGITSGFAACLIWGLFPLYWGFLEPSSPTEVLAARIVFSLVAMAALVSVVRQWAAVHAVLTHGRTLRILTVAAALVTVNWGVYIWAVANAHVVDASLGYFVNPLVSVALGVVVLGERLRRAQWLAVSIAALAVLYATVSLGRVPWVALVLAFSFGLYGLAKKVAGAEAIPSLTVELIVLTPFALGYVAWLSSHGGLAFGHHGTAHTLLMMGAGPVTALPLLLFGHAATRVPLSLLGLLQYITPSIQLALGVVVLDEQMSPQRWLAFAGVWLALVVFTVDALHHRRPAGEGAALTGRAPRYQAASLEDPAPEAR